MPYQKKLFTEDQFVVPKEKYKILRKETSGNSVSNNLNTIREILGLTQIAVSDKIKINRETYSNYEKGKCHVPSNIIIDLLNMYKIPADLIFGTTENKFVEEFYISHLRKRKEVVYDIN